MTPSPETDPRIDELAPAMLDTAADIYAAQLAAEDNARQRGMNPGQSTKVHWQGLRLGGAVEVIQTAFRVLTGHTISDGEILRLIAERYTERAA